jgi:hypothetical protein
MSLNEEEKYIGLADIITHIEEPFGKPDTAFGDAINTELLDAEVLTHIAYMALPGEETNKILPLKKQMK